MAEFDFLKPERWHYFHKRYRTPFFVDLWTHGIAHPMMDIGFDYSVRYVGQVAFKTIVDAQSFERQRQDLLHRLETDPSWLKQFIDRFYHHYQTETLPAWQALQAIDPSPLSPPELAELLARYQHATYRYSSFILAPLAVEHDLTERIQAELQEHFGQDRASDYFNVMSTQSIDPGSLGNEERSLLVIAAKQASGDDVTKALDEHWRTYRWMANQRYAMEFAPLASYQERLADLVANDPQATLAALDAHRAAQRAAYDGVLSEVAPFARLRASVETLQLAIVFRNFRSEEFFHSSLAVERLLVATARQLGLTSSQLVWLTIGEIQEHLRTGTHVDRTLIADRQRGFGLLTNVAGGLPIIGARLALLASSIRIDEAADSEAITGTTAYPGMVSGRARVIHDPSELPSIEPGEIVVTHSTNVAFVPYLKRVAAIVTEEGGVLSHASMIARELKIPTIIGTKTATKQLRTGELVEVNADAGTVRRIDE